MFYNYLITALLSLRRQPAFSAIKIFSLTLGLACSILVLMHVQYTYSYDKHIPNWQNIYRLVTSFTTDQRIDTPLIAEGYTSPFRIDYPQIVNSAMIRESSGQFLRNGESLPNSYFWVEPEIIDVFSLQFVSGDPDTALNGTNAVVLNQTTAEKYFGDEDPMGQILTLDNQTDLRVTGIMSDLPTNTHLDIQMMIAAETGRQLFNENFMNNNAWAGFNGTMLYFTLPNAAEAESISNGLEEFVNRNVPDQQRRFVNQIDITLTLEQLGDVYLSPREGFRNDAGSRAQILAGLVIFAVLILITSSINFANLSLSQIQQRGKEIGVRKTLGASRWHVVIQILFESMLMTVIALLIALPFIYFAIPVYTAYTNTEFTAGLLLQSNYTAGIILFVLATGFISGLVPAVTVSRHQPATVIKGIIAKGKFSQAMRSLITVVQFSLSTILVLVALAIALQISHLGEMEIGFNRYNLVVLDSNYNPRNPEQFNYEAMVNELKQHPGIISVAKSQVAPPNTGPYNPWRRPEWEETERRPVSHYGIDTEYIDTYQLQLIAGRGFSEEFPADFLPAGQPDPEQTYGVIITRAAVGNFNFESEEAALNQLLEIGGIKFRIVGVLNDFRLAGGMEDVLRSTSILRVSREPMRTVSIRIDPSQTESALGHIDNVWARHRPDVPIERSFYEQTFDDLVSESTGGISMASLFASIVTIGIAVLGLYALAFYTTQRRTKEVGIRKVLGATSNSIIGLLTWDFVKPVLLACAIASIGGYYATSYFFAQFSSRPEMPISLYLLVTLSTILLAVCTVSIQCFRTASSDPVKSLRYE